MNLLKRITFFKHILSIQKKYYIYIFFILLHLFLFNINTAEWGDSYRILRSAENIRRLTYETKEKRPPLVAAAIAVRPNKVDAVTWGRVVMFVFSILSLVVFDKLVSIYIKDEKYQLISLLFFVFNPVYLYWSIRIMTDVPFSFFVLIAFYLLLKWKNSLNVKKSILLGFVCGLAILTRFEGYLLTLSIVVGVLYLNKEFLLRLIKPKVVIDIVIHKIRFLVPLGLTTLVVILPWLVFRNPLDSKYLDEPEYRTYDLRMAWIYFVSILYLFGFSQFFYFIFKNPAGFIKFFKQNLGIAAFTLLELILVLVWPAAVPRLFIPIIPFLIIAFISLLEKADARDSKARPLDICVIVFITFFYALSQYVLKLQFLVASRNILIMIFLIQLVLMFMLVSNKRKGFMAIAVLSMLVWSMSIVYLHRNLYYSIKNASEYATNNLSGRVGYNDVNGVSNWYINWSGINKNIGGYYFEPLQKSDLDFKKILKKNPDYLILTNEHNPDMNFDFSKRPYLTVVKDFRYNVNGRDFFATVIKFNKDYYK